MRNVVLVAHRDPDTLEKYLDALDAAGFNCLATSSGSDALEAGLSYGPQFAVLQVELGDVQGTDVCLRLKQERAGIVIVILGRDTKDERFVSQEIGADLLLVEPVDAPTLVKEVKALHARVARAIG